MKDKNETKKQLVNELVELRQRNIELKGTETRCKLIEESLLKERTFAESALNALNDIFVVFELSGEFLKWNRAMSKVTKYSDDEILLMKPTDFFSKEDTQRVEEAIKTVVREGYTRLEVIGITKDGRHIPYEIYGTLLTGEDANPACICVIARDITERKYAEEELKKVSDALERSNTELRQIAFGVAHDLLNPLNIIAGCIYLFEQNYKGKLDTKFDNLLGYSLDEFNKIKRLVEDLLTYAQLEKKSQDFKSVDLSSVVDIAVNLFQQDVKESGAVVTFDNLPVVMADKIQMIRLFQNLISNAIKYRGEESLQIHISAERRWNEWIFSVQDNGIGIDPKHFDKIFPIFQRLHDGSKYQGTGIGLAICKKIVECHGGRIWVESQPGKGSIFYFTIPNKSNSRI